MTGAMYAAVSGLKAHMSALNVIGQNISNVNTNAYKATRYTFLEALYTSVRGGSDGSNLLGGKNPAQVGYGSSIGTIDLDMSTKNYTPTGKATDIMIDGDGFLIVGDKGGTFGTTGTKDLSDMYLTRLGNLEFDNQGYLVDGQGQVVYGYLSVKSPLYEAAAAYGTSLTKPDPNDATKTLEGIDALNTVKSVMENAAANPPPTGQGVETAFKDKSFYVNDKGQVVQAKLKDGKTESGNPDDYDFMVVDEFTPAPVLTPIRIPMRDENGSAVYPTWNKETGTIDDGSSVNGRIVKDSVSIDENTGRITCTTESGEAVVVGSIAIAKVENPNGVTHVDGHYYQALAGAGRVSLTSIGHSVKNASDADSPFHWNYTRDATTGEIDITQDPTEVNEVLPGEMGISSSGSTKVISNGLESSGTDLATEISNMIMVQRGYQANTRIVTVTDSMLEELVNMKR